MAESLLASPTVVNLTKSDIPGALLSGKPYDARAKIV